MAAPGLDLVPKAEERADRADLGKPGVERKVEGEEEGASWGPAKASRPSLSGTIFSRGLALHSLILSTDINEYLLCAGPTRQGPLATPLPYQGPVSLGTLRGAGFPTRRGAAGGGSCGSGARAQFAGGGSPEPGSLDASASPGLEKRLSPRPPNTRSPQMCSWHTVYTQ